MKKIIYTIIIFILLFCLSINIFSLFFDISFFGFRIFKVGSGSMEPYLQINDVIIIRTCEDYKVNDVVTYKNNKEYITHRIIFINDDEIITKGDANNTQDDPITKEQIIGKVIYKFHIFGFIEYMLADFSMWILLFLIGVFAVCLIPSKRKSN